MLQEAVQLLGVHGHVERVFVSDDAGPDEVRRALAKDDAAASEGDRVYLAPATLEMLSPKTGWLTITEGRRRKPSHHHSRQQNSGGYQHATDWATT